MSCSHCRAAARRRNFLCASHSPCSLHRGAFASPLASSGHSKVALLPAGWPASPGAGNGPRKGSAAASPSQKSPCAPSAPLPGGWMCAPAQTSVPSLTVCSPALLHPILPLQPAEEGLGREPGCKAWAGSALMALFPCGTHSALML